MREIKFRAWDKLHRQGMNDWEKILRTGFGLYLSEKFGFELMQYTGLKDNNGVEIYEGDIIKTRFEKLKLMKVIFRDGGFVGTHSDNNDVKDLGLIPDNSLIRGGEVIGNIWENHELLKEKHEN